MRPLTEFSFFYGLKPAITNFFSCDNITNVVDDNNEPIVKLSILLTDFRTNWIYIRVYILWMNMIVMILIPFVLLLYLNLQVRILKSLIIGSPSILCPLTHFKVGGQVIKC